MSCVRFICRVLLFAVIVFNPLHAAEEAPYETLFPAVDTGLKDKVLVVEVFLYSCPHCYRFDPIIEKWRQTLPDYVEFTRMPAVYNNPRGLLLAKAFYVAEALGALDTIHEQLFRAYHNKKQRFHSELELQAFFEENGVSAEDFRAAYESFGVDMRLRQARGATNAYGIRSVPILVINGKYKMESGKAGGYQNMLKLADELIEKERQTMGIELPEPEAAAQE